LSIEVLSPDIGHSGMDFTIEASTTLGRAASEENGKSTPVDRPSAIRFGLGAIKNVGEGPVQTILETRAHGGPFKSLDDFCERVDLRQLNRRVLESLIKAGAMDALGRREQLLEVIDRMLEKSAEKHVNTEQYSMFAMDAFLESEANFSLCGSLPDVEEIPQKQLLLWEKELIGLYVSGHPLQHASTALAQAVTAYCGEIGEEGAGQRVTIGGIVTSVRTILTRAEKQMAFVQVEDLRGTIEVIVFPRLFEETHEKWQEDKILIIAGTIDCKNGTPKILADSVQDRLITGKAVGDNEEENVGPPPTYQQKQTRMQILMNRTGDAARDIQCLQDIQHLLKQFPGEDPYTIAIIGEGKQIGLCFPDAKTRVCPELQQAIQEVLGAGSVQIT
jgi:DNA polymerase-3 subunit alpha